MPFLLIQFIKFILIYIPFLSSDLKLICLNLSIHQQNNDSSSHLPPLIVTVQILKKTRTSPTSINKQFEAITEDPPGFNSNATAFQTQYLGRKLTLT